MNHFSMDYNIDYMDVDRYHDLTPEALMRIFGRVSSYHEVFGYRLKPGYMSEWNKAWVLYQWKIKVKEPKQYARKVKIHTLVTIKRDMYCYRYYLIEDMQGKEIAHGVAQWVAVDLEKRRISRIPEPVLKIISQKSPLTEEVWARIPNIDLESLKRKDMDIDFQMEIPVLYSDIDSNMHVNNIIYSKWALETINAMDPEFLNSNCHSSFEIVYKKEKRPGGHVISKLQLSGDTSWHEILDEEENLLCLIRVIWTDKVKNLGDYSNYDIDAMLAGETGIDF